MANRSSRRLSEPNPSQPLTERSRIQHGASYVGQLRIALAALLLLPSAARAQSGSDPAAVHDTLRLYYVGHAIGREIYALARTGVGDSAYSLTADYDYTDRGRRTHVTATARTTADFSPRHLEVSRLTDTSTTVEARLDVRDGRAQVLSRGRTADVLLPRGTVAIAGTAPVSQHLLLLRYWASHGRPRTLRAIPGGPTNTLTIVHRGRDTLPLGDRRVVLDRYAVDGVTWGVEAMWLDQAGRLAALSTTGGGLTLDAVRLELDALLPALVDIATRDRLADMTRLSHSVYALASGDVALVGATLIDGTGRAAIADATVVVAGGRIVAAGARNAVAIPRHAKRVDVTGRTIMPGLWDMHSHVMQMEWAPVYLAAGVTTVRDMGNNLYFIVPFRAAIDSGRIIGPHLLLAGLVDGGGPNAFGAVTATTPAEGRAVVGRYHELGFEQIKLYDLVPADVVGVIVAEAHRLGMTVTGHVPRALGLLASVDSGMDQIAHLPIRGDSSADSVHAQIRALRAHGTVVDPTAAWGELLGHSTAEPVANLIPGVVNLPPVLAQRVNGMGVATIDTAAAHARMRRTLGVLRALHDAGVPLVAGTDEGVPGYSVSREVELYMAAGIPPMDALRAATAVSARAMGMERRTGTIEPGKEADLLVLDGNPLDAVRNLQRVRLVMKAGALYRSADLWRAAGFTPPR
jgi:imidazolonepropionase-like amidohydrolase